MQIPLYSLVYITKWIIKYDEWYFIHSAFSGTDSNIQSKYGLFPCKI